MKRFAPILVICFAVLLSIHTISLMVYMRTNHSDQMKRYREDLVQEVMNVVHMMQATPPEQLTRAIQSLNTNIVTVTLTDSPTFSRQITNLSYWYINKLIDNDSSPNFTLSLQLPNNSWVNVKASSQTQSTLWTHLIMLFAELGVGLIIFFYAWSINRYTEPLKNFQQVASGLGMQSKSTHLEEYKGPRVVRETAEAMNEMQQRIRDLLNDRTMMLAAISHDLRTPITRLKLRANFFDDEELTQQTLADLDVMDKMITEILQFSKNENEDEAKRKLDLNSLIQTISDELSDTGLAICYHPPALRCPYPTREVKFRRALINLIQNAVKYGKKADIHLKKETNGYVITITDHGPGIAEEEKEKVFRPFYRLDYSRSRKIEGTGLGLAIAQSAVHAHGGHIALENREKGGLEVTITLPND